MMRHHILLLILLMGCMGQARYPDTTREQAIPDDAVKMTPAEDRFPPMLHSGEFEDPVPLGMPPNSAGAEDSPFITPDGKDLYFFFTPYVDVPVTGQLLDNVTGIWHSERSGASWSELERVWLNEPGELSLDGCGFVQAGEIWFCTARAGNFREIDIWKARISGANASGWRNAGKELNVDVGIGEFHFSSDWSEVYFHSTNDTRGGMDLFVSRRIGGQWQPREGIDILNTAENEGYPFLSQDGTELWFTRFYNGTPGIFRSKKVNGSWSEGELILSQFAGEPTLDAQGNIYFVHHFFDGKGDMIEADIYVARRR